MKFYLHGEGEFGRWGDAGGLVRRLEWLALAWLRKPSTSSVSERAERQHGAHCEAGER